MMLDAGQKLAEERSQGERKDRDADYGKDGPEQKGVPLPEPELADEREGMLVGGVEELVRRQGHGRGVEDAAGDADEGDDEDDLERIDDVVSDLRGSYVEAEGDGDGEAEDCGAAKDRIDADKEAKGEAPGELFRGCSHAKERKDGKNNAAIEPVVMDGRRALTGLAESWFVRLHF